MDRGLAAPPLGWRDQRFNQPPLRLAQVAGIAQTLALRRPAMYVRPHVVPLQLPDTTYRITSDSTDSTTFRNGSKENTMSLIVEGVAIPDSKLAREITEVVRDTEAPLLFHPSSRVYYFGALTG